MRKNRKVMMEEENSRGETNVGNSIKMTTKDSKRESSSEETLDEDEEEEISGRTEIEG